VSRLTLARKYGLIVARTGLPCSDRIMRRIERLIRCSASFEPRPNSLVSRSSIRCFATWHV
jgi:hypothetical protein